MRILSSGKNHFFKGIRTEIKLCIKSSLKMINSCVKNTEWYRNTYGDVVKIKQHNVYNLDLMVLGSSAVKYGLDFSKQNIKAANFAMVPQDTATASAIIQNYHCFIKENGLLLLLLLCPFQGLGLDYPPSGDYHDRLHHFLHFNLMEQFSESILARVNWEIEYPLLFKTKTAVKALIKKILGKEQRTIDPYTDAVNRLAGWKKEFNIKSLDDPISA
jgi:hypothetical protein